MNFLLDVKYGGLGDHLFYSPIPRLLKEKYGDQCKVYLCETSPFRNRQTYELIWANNPFLDGLKKKSELFFEELSDIELSLDFHVSQRLLARFSLYYKNEVDPEIHYVLPSSTGKHSHLIDLNYSSYTGLLESDILKIIRRTSRKYIFINPATNLKKIIPKHQCYQTNSLFEYAFMIQKSKSFICLTSGGATLARALGVTANVFTEPFYPQMFKHKKNNHITVGRKNILRRLVGYYLWHKNFKLRNNDFDPADNLKKKLAYNVGRVIFFLDKALICYGYEMLYRLIPLNRSKN